MSAWPAPVAGGAARRAIEALRAGVPSDAAVAVLGTMQPDLEDRFGQLLDAVRATGPGGGPPEGLLIAGGFGAGKSHLLTHLGRVAARSGFVVSHVVVSKETPLHDPTKVFRTAVASAMVAGARPDDLLGHLAERVDTGSPEWAALHRHVHTPSTGLDARFAASVALFAERPLGDDELTNALVRFWAGDPLPVAAVRSRLKAAPELGSYTLGPAKERALFLQRFGFVARLCRAAGYGGWLVMFDEAELIGRYGAGQRAKAYAELASWLHGRPEDPRAPLAAVVAITDDFDAAVLVGKGDAECLPAKLRSKGGDAAVLADAAVRGMRAIERSAVRLRPPTDADLDDAYRRLKALHGAAFSWDPPDVAGLERASATRLREYVRAWINEWDLVRLDPTYRPATEWLALEPSYAEDADLDREAGPG